MYNLIYIYINHPHQTGKLCGHHSKTHGRIFSPIWSTSKCALGELGAVTCGCWDENFDKRRTPSTLRLQRRPWLWAEGIDVDGIPHWPLRTAWCEWDVPLSQSSNILVLHQTPSAYSIGIVNGAGDLLQRSPNTMEPNLNRVHCALYNSYPGTQCAMCHQGTRTLSQSVTGHGVTCQKHCETTGFPWPLWWPGHHKKPLTWYTAAGVAAPHRHDPLDASWKRSQMAP